MTEDDSPDQEKKRSGAGEKRRKKLNKHGLPFLDDYEAGLAREQIDESEPVPAETGDGQEEGDIPDEDFSTLYEQSLKQGRSPRHIPKPMPLKRRLKRYPQPEADLDLHGFTAIGAQIKARAFITDALHQGFFTLRIIVGKGLHSEAGPVLPDVVEDLLKVMKKEKIVLAYAWEGRKKSKSGSVVVYLKRFTD